MTIEAKRENVTLAGGSSMLDATAIVQLDTAEAEPGRPRSSANCPRLRLLVPGRTVLSLLVVAFHRLRFLGSITKH
jgi:hypothetical protein